MAPGRYQGIRVATAQPICQLAEMYIRKLLVLGLFALAGCASFPQRPALIGYDPAPYGDAFRAAAAEAVIRSRVGVGFYEAFQGKAHTISMSGRCTEAALARFLAKDIGCWLLAPGDNAQCREQDLCIRLRAERQFFNGPAIRSDIERALLNPCDALTPPEEVLQPRWTSMVGKTAAASWAILRCGSRRQVIGREIVVREDGSETVILFRFDLGDAAR